MSRWLLEIYRTPKRWGVIQGILWGVMMFVANLVRDIQRGQEITAGRIIIGIILAFLGAVVFGGFMYWLREKKIENEGQ